MDLNDVLVGKWSIRTKIDACSADTSGARARDKDGSVLHSDRSAKPEDVAVGIWQSRVSADSMGAVGQRPGWRRGASGEVSQLG
jgi:hypothetical protein